MEHKHLTGTQTWGQLLWNVIDYITITFQYSWLNYITITSIFKCNWLNYYYFVNGINQKVETIHQKRVAKSS
jgi:hypothetical protein